MRKSTNGTGACSQKRQRSEAALLLQEVQSQEGREEQVPHREEVDLEQCRPLRSHCQTVKFCGQTHLNACLSKKKKAPPVGREALDTQQLASLFQTLVELGRAWAAVMGLCQLFLGERADCVRQLRTSWLRNLGPQEARTPAVCIPEGVNKKTTCREVPLHSGLATLLHNWMFREPLRGAQQSWPHPGQEVQEGDRLLFPGLVLKTQARAWGVAVSERAYLHALTTAAGVIQSQRQFVREAGGRHIFEDVDLSRIGTHTFKKSHVTLMKCEGASSSLISSITGTTAATLEKHYDVPTRKRQHHAINASLGPVLDMVAFPADAQPSSPKNAINIWRPWCGSPCEIQWNFCQACGQKLPTLP